ncbi:MAG TPA: DUF1553 domain-containing protein, partial [Verrucomicrobiae bacterium]
QGTNVALGKPVTALDSIEASPAWSKANLVNGESVLTTGLTENFRDPAKLVEYLRQTQATQRELSQLNLQREKLAAELLPATVVAEIKSLEANAKQVKLELSKLPEQQLVYAAASDFKPEGSFLPAKGVRPVHLLKRGDVTRPGELMHASALPAVPGPEADFRLAEPGNEGERRAALALWITDPKNMLTRRSIGNRIWQYDFGKGLVDSPNDFGHMGALPTHPELLDWLAYWFLDHGESIKDLHRLLLTSATYRQVSSEQAEYAKKDGDNRWLWRMNRERLDAECIRDSMLYVSGKLDLTMGGPSVRQFYFKDDHSPVYDYSQYDLDSPGANRRSIYRLLVRSVPDPFMDCLDCADPSLLVPKRNSTLTALQALATLNNPFVLKQCECLAKRLSNNSADTGQQIASAYQLALSRAPSERETKVLVDFARKHGLANACRVLFNSSEFMFVD